ncbi:MAG: polyprenyl synthetase family protein [Atopobiaceae bacterium]|nr:polyprenyl synthetase family protein [Atopobiaceae bacterium]
MSSDGNSFVTYLATHKRAIDECVLGHAPLPLSKTDQVDDLRRYLYDPLADFVGAGGKRVRPVLCLLGAEAVGANPSVAYGIAAAVELFQAAALIHDDIADKSSLRRGIPCLHVSQGTGLAINAGDAALVSVSSCVLNDETLDSQTRIALLKEIVDMENQTLEGQALDLGWVRDQRWDVLTSDYLAMARRKTAHYSAATPLVLGAICGGGGESSIEGLREFGLNAGLAFQIQDDLLNLVGDAEAQGKDYRSDITEGKRTLVMMWALEHLDKPKREELIGILSSGTTQKDLVDRAIELADEAGALDHARSYARELTRRAKEGLRATPITEDARQVLFSMADFFIERNA